MNKEEILYELLTSQYSDTDSLIELWNNCYMVTKVYKMERFEEIIGDSFKRCLTTLSRKKVVDKSFISRYNVIIKLLNNLIKQEGND